MEVKTHKTPIERSLNTVSLAFKNPPTIAGLAPVGLSPTKRQWKHRSRYKALGHCLERHFTVNLWVKTGETPVWHRMRDAYQVFCTTPATYQRLTGLHPRFDGVPP
ncbi:hypothetical protein HAX54_029547, partial [Datura stramonium]|nr:hypothetical protein [Datura stramonium]